VITVVFPPGTKGLCQARNAGGARFGGVGTDTLMASDKQFQRIIATLQRTMDLPLTQSQRGATVPSFRLKEEADAKRAALARAEAAEKRVKELEDKLEEALARRSWWRR
jgi:hypothetical protein